jgi:hypothetical protein
LNKELLRQLRESSEFQVIMTDMAKMRPVVPDYRPQGSTEANSSYIELIKYQSGMKDGFDLLYRALIGR